MPRPDEGPITGALSSIFAIKPTKGFLRNLETMELKRFLFNPSTLKEEYSTRWKRKSIPGLPFQRLQWDGGDNAVWSIRLFFDQLHYGQKRILGESQVEDWRRFAISLTLGTGSQNIVQAAPPPVLFSWPGMIRARCRVAKVSFDHIMFNVAGTPEARAYYLNVTLIEDPIRRFTSDEVRLRGMDRPWASVGNINPIPRNNRGR